MMEVTTEHFQHVAFFRGDFFHAAKNDSKHVWKKKKKKTNFVYLKFFF